MTTQTPDVKALADRLERAIITMQNDDLSKPGTDKRERHTERYEAMADVLEYLCAPEALRAAPEASGAEPVADLLTLADLVETETRPERFVKDWGLIAKALRSLASPPPADVRGTDGELWSASKHDEIIKRLMADVGQPNSMSLYVAFKLFANELHALATPPVADAGIAAAPEGDDFDPNSDPVAAHIMGAAKLHTHDHLMAWKITKLAMEGIAMIASPPAASADAVREALLFYADPFAWKVKNDPENDVQVPDFYSETNFGDTAQEALAALTAPVAGADAGNPVCAKNARTEIDAAMRERLKKELQISSPLDLRNWRDITRALDALSPDAGVGMPSTDTPS